MKYGTYLMLTGLLGAGLLCGCGASPDDTVSGKAYSYTGESFSGAADDDFIIAFYDDGTYSYAESTFSSYIGFGEWTMDGDVVTLTEDENTGYPSVQRFRLDGDDIIYIAEDSSNFQMVEVQDGDIFTCADED